MFLFRLIADFDLSPIRPARRERKLSRVLTNPEILIGGPREASDLAAISSGDDLSLSVVLV
jgi:hypothetical protein